MNNKLKDKLVIGTWPLSGDYGHVNLKIVQETLETCYEHGLREFDTAPSYGNGFIEHCLGNVMANKDDVLINTKVGNAAFLGKSFSVDDMRISFEQSLKRLSIEKVNILFLHNPRDDLDNNKVVIDFMSSLQEEGKLRFKGISLAKNYDYDPEFLKEFDVVQDDGNLLDMRFINLDLPKRINFMARSPLAGGILSGNITAESIFPVGDHRSGWLIGERLNSILRRVNKLTTEFDMEIIELAKKFVFSNSKIQKVIFGVKNPEHVSSILRRTDTQELDRETVEKLIKLYLDDFGLEGEKHLSF